MHRTGDIVFDKEQKKRAILTKDSALIPGKGGYEICLLYEDGTTDQIYLQEEEIDKQFDRIGFSKDLSERMRTIFPDRPLKFVEASMLKDLIRELQNYSRESISDLIDNIAISNVVPVEAAMNINPDLDECDQFICSSCGLHLQGWIRIVRYEDVGIDHYYDYAFQYCPNCGAKIMRSLDEK